MLIIKAKNRMSREDIKNMYRNLLEQMQLGLVFVDDNYEISVVEPCITGHWKSYLKEGLKFQCSNCDSRFTTPWEYCPHCNARMVEPQESEG